MNLSFKALGKTVDVDFSHAGSSQYMSVCFGGKQVDECFGEILSYPREIQTGIVRGAAADAWERKQLREIAEQILAEKVVSDES
tara:strand:+ start:2130 stop:2381 length:252 start_codon:yes stop_codon:yes gene_type:complete